MEPTSISLPILYSMKCRNCKFPITCEPVLLLHDSTVLCGRCRKYSTNVFRNYCYEILASLYLYPCKNWPNHCQIKLHWNETLKHEKHCSYTGCCRFFFSHPGACMKGPRPIPDDECIPRVVPDKLMEDLQCNLCGGYLNCEPVYLSENSKNICHRCVKSNGSPPGAIHNLPYEHISRTFLFSCVYKSKGCDIFAPFGRGLWQHECNCPFRQDARKTIYSDRNKENNGLIQTQTGAMWTNQLPEITPLFAPPTNSARDQNKDLLKSLAIHQHKRRIRKIDEIDIYDIDRSISESDISTTTASHDQNGRFTPEDPADDYHRSNNLTPLSNTKPFGYGNYPFNDSESRTSSILSTRGGAVNDRSSLATAKINPVHNKNYNSQMQRYDYDHLMVGPYPPVTAERQRGFPQRSESNRYDYERTNNNNNNPNGYYPSVNVHRHTLNNDVNNASANNGYRNPADYTGHFPVKVPRRLNNNNSNNDQNDNDKKMGISRAASFKENQLLINELRIKQDIRKLQKSLQEERVQQMRQDRY